jgi:acyl carrier protein
LVSALPQREKGALTAWTTRDTLLPPTTKDGCAQDSHPRAKEAFMDEIRQAVQDYILSEFLTGEDPAELTDATPLITGGILDSISTLKLVVFLEERFGVIVEAHEADVDNLDSVGRIARLIESKKCAA